ncbi:hypothetical protein H0H81_003860 [Sphagnurus paluster]|uniref:Uncharacterized protein n=1 Tax=Sphagnurus paluster TaxID=117069 RepID=A0A9P7K684_9AGAR|nr:hypothetical protein H0H81_003860 [Sphagnurus paluster]
MNRAVSPTTALCGLGLRVGPDIADRRTLGAHGGACFVTRFRNDLCANSIPVVEATAYVAQTHVTRMEPYAAVFNGWRVPCLGLTVVGSDVTFYAIITIGHQYRVVPLTSTLSCLPEANDGEDRKKLYSAFAAASVLLTFIQEDGARYAKSPPPRIPDHTHSYPAVTELQRYGSAGAVRFQITELRPDEQSHRLLYLARTDDGREIIVKFTQRYCIELHDFCASRKLSPEILGFERLPGGWYAIAMEYLPSAAFLTPNKEGLRQHGQRWFAEMRGLVESFHAAGFVHGDLREVNIICAGDRALLIDFDWGGKAGEVSYPFRLSKLNPELLLGRSSTETTITVADDLRVLQWTLGKARASVE